MKYKILIVDDEEMILSMMKKCLKVKQQSETGQLMLL